MRNDDFKKIPATRVTLSSPGAGRRNETVVSVSGYRSKSRNKPEKAERAADNRYSGNSKGYFEDSDNIYYTGRNSKPHSRRPQSGYGAAEEDISHEERRTEERSFGAFIAELIVSMLLLAGICSLRTVQVYASNVSLVSFEQLGNTMWIYMVFSFLVFAILRIFMRRPYFAGIFVAFATFFAVNLDWLYNFMRLFFNEYNSAAIGSLALYLVLLVAFFFVLRALSKKKFPFNAVAKILTAVYTGLVVVNVVMAFIALGSLKGGKTQVASVVQPDPTATPTIAVPTPTVNANPAEPQAFGKPNIYFFFMDEFSSFDMLDKYYGYDAKPLNDFLTLAGFNISRESYATDNETQHCFADMFSLDYVSNKLSGKQRLKKIQQGPLRKTLADLGYTEYQIGNRPYFKGAQSLTGGGPVDDLGEDEIDNTVYGDVGADDIASTGTVSGIIDGLLGNMDTGSKVNEAKLNNYGFYPSDYIRDTKAYKSYKDKNKIAVADFTLKSFDYFQSASSYANLSSPRVTYCYLLATHVPFTFNEYGGILPWKENRNWEDPDIYLNQYKFINKEMIAAVSSIIKNDPNSIIVIMSDHGIRYHIDCTRKMKFVITDKDSCRIMNAVYIKGQKYDIEGLSAVNTLRYILSLYEGQEQNFPPIKDPITSDSPSCLKGIIPHSRYG